MDMKIFKNVTNSLKYWKINLDHYTYMKKNGDIPSNHNFTSLGPKKQVQLTSNVNSLECKKN
jgi:hypothetical protein